MAFGLVMLLILGAAHYVIYRNLITAGLPALPLRVMMVVMTILFPLSRSIIYRYSGTFLSVMIWTSSLWLGVMVLLLFGYTAVFVLQLVLRLFIPGLAIPRSLVAIWTTILVLFISAAGLINALRGPVIVKHTIDRTARYGQGKSVRIVHLSDMHLGPQLGERFAKSVIQIANAQNPDIIVLTGDIMDSEEQVFARISPLLSGLRAKSGVYAVSGNHDFYGGIGAYVRYMKEAGIPVLDREVIMSPAGIQISGVHDRRAISRVNADALSDVVAATNAINPLNPSILLIHQPRGLEPAVEKQVDLILAGHTHKGQMFPFSIFVKSMYPLFYGRYQLSSNSELLVSSGTGFWGPPLRILSNSEILVIEFKY